MEDKKRKILIILGAILFLIFLLFPIVKMGLSQFGIGSGFMGVNNEKSGVEYLIRGNE